MNLLTKLFLKKRKFFTFFFYFLLLLQTVYSVFWYLHSKNGYIAIKKLNKEAAKLEKECHDLNEKKKISLKTVEQWKNAVGQHNKYEESARTILKYAFPDEIVFYQVNEDKKI